METNETKARCGLLLSRDLFFTSKVTGTARELGLEVKVAGSPESARASIEQACPRVVFVDLAAADLASPSAIAEYRALTGLDVPFVAFGSHVDVESLERARAAGCIALPRSRFTNELPDLIRAHLGAGAGAGAEFRNS